MVCFVTWHFYVAQANLKFAILLLHAFSVDIAGKVSPCPVHVFLQICKYIFYILYALKTFLITLKLNTSYEKEAYMLANLKTTLSEFFIKQSKVEPASPKKDYIPQKNHSSS